MTHVPTPGPKIQGGLLPSAGRRRPVPGPPRTPPQDLPRAGPEPALESILGWSPRPRPPSARMLHSDGNPAPPIWHASCKSNIRPTPGGTANSRRLDLRAGDSQPGPGSVG